MKTVQTFKEENFTTAVEKCDLCSQLTPQYSIYVFLFLENIKNDKAVDQISPMPMGKI